MAVWGDATRDDRPRPDGRQHGAPAPPRRTRLCRARRRRSSDRRARERTRCHRRSFVERPRRGDGTAQGDLDHGARRVRRRHSRFARAAARCGRHDHRRRQLVVPPRRRPIRGARTFGDHVSRCRHERRRVRARTRLLPDDRRPDRRRRTADSDLRNARSGHRHRRSHSGSGRSPKRRRSTAGCTAVPAAQGTS